MWIFLRNSLLSITDQGDPGGATLLVSAWRDGDIRAIFPDACVIEHRGGGCAFCARIERRVVTEVIADQIESLGARTRRQASGAASIPTLIGMSGR